MFLPSNFKNYALVCPPTNTVKRGLRMKDMGAIDVALAKEQHAAYCRALEGFGYSLVCMRANARYPDSVFVEDPAIIIGNALVIARLRRLERRGEEWYHQHTLVIEKNYFDSRVFYIDEENYVEGGDVLITHNCLYIGLSARTTIQGAEQLAKIAYDRCGYYAEMFEIPKQYLHLKGEVTYHRLASSQKPILTVSEEMAARFHAYNTGCEIIETPADELYGGNNISVPDGRILSHAWCKKTHKLLRKFGFRVQPIDLGEYPKINGAMSCLSKLFTAPAIV